MKGWWQNTQYVSTQALSFGPEDSRLAQTYPSWEEESRIKVIMIIITLSYERIGSDEKTSIVWIHDWIVQEVFPQLFVVVVLGLGIPIIKQQEK